VQPLQPLTLVKGPGLYGAQPIPAQIQTPELHQPQKNVHIHFTQPVLIQTHPLQIRQTLENLGVERSNKIGPEQQLLQTCQPLEHNRIQAIDLIAGQIDDS